MLNLGTNDSRQGRSTAQAASACDQMLTVLHSAGCVVPTAISVGATSEIAPGWLRR